VTVSTKHIVGVNAEEPSVDPERPRVICPAPAVYRASCSCGWSARILETIDRARVLALNHQREAIDG
jgi:hypothetical protein